MTSPHSKPSNPDPCPSPSRRPSPYPDQVRPRPARRVGDGCEGRGCRGKPRFAKRALDRELHRPPASSGRARRLWAARHSQRGHNEARARGRWVATATPLGCGCSGGPPPISPRDHLCAHRTRRTAAFVTIHRRATGSASPQRRSWASGRRFRLGAKRFALCVVSK
jgi:hypothetical protein